MSMEHVEGECLHAMLMTYPGVPGAPEWRWSHWPLSLSTPAPAPDILRDSGSVRPGISRAPQLATSDILKWYFVF